MESSLFLLIFLGLLFDFTNGFHDAANVVSTVIATNTLTAKKAVILAGLFNILGALCSSEVARTIASDLVSVSLSENWIVSAALMGAISWNFITWYLGLPSSSSAALIGGLIGVTWYQMGLDSVLWHSVLKKVLLPMLISPIVGFLLSYLIMKLYYKYSRKSQAHDAKLKSLQLISSLFVSLSHGMNDAQKSMGIITLGLYLSRFISEPIVPIWVVVLCALTMGIGTSVGGFRIIKTVGYNITRLSVAQGCASEFSTASTILSGSYLGMPLSSTHVIVGAISGSGAAKSFHAVHWKLWQRFCLAWFVTCPASSLIAIATINIIKVILK